MDGIWSTRRPGDHFDCLTSKGKKLLKKHRQQSQPQSPQQIQQQQQHRKFPLPPTEGDRQQLNQESNPLLVERIEPVMVEGSSEKLTSQEPVLLTPSGTRSHSIMHDSKIASSKDLLSEQQELKPNFDNSTPDQASCRNDQYSEHFQRQASAEEPLLLENLDVQCISSEKCSKNCSVSIDINSSLLKHDDRNESDDIDIKNVEIRPKKRLQWFQRSGVDIRWSNLSVKVGTKTVLNNISGRCVPGQLFAIMGPSGSGKTTLLNALSGRQRCEGTVTIGGRQLTRKMRHLVGYSLQQDLFHPNRGLRQMLEMTAELRLSASLTSDEKKCAVDSIIDMLGLDQCQGTIIGNAAIRGLSGGERKRASIACELLTDPPILVLDEPTSGLDSHSAHALLVSLKRLAEEKGKAVILTLHQPSSKIFHMLDSVLLLSGGEPAYFGTSSDVVPYLRKLNLVMAEHYNPADFLLEAAHDIPEQLVRYFKENNTSMFNESNTSSSGISSEDQLTSCLGNTQKLLVVPSDDNEGLQTQGNHQPAVDRFKNFMKVTTPRFTSSTCQNRKESHAFSSISMLDQSNPKNDIVMRSTELDKLSSSLPDVHHIAKDSDSGNESCSSDSRNSHDSCTQPPPHSSNASPPELFEGKIPPPPYPVISMEDLDACDERWPATYWTQCKVLTLRCFAVYRPIITSKINWIQTVSLALIAGILWFQADRNESKLTDIQGYMFFSTFYWMMHSHFQAFSTFPQEKALLQKERESGWYRISAFYISKTLSELPLTILLPSLYFSISYPMTGGTSLTVFASLLSMLLLNALVAQSFGLLMSVLIDNTEHCWAISGVMTVFQQIFGGYLATSVPVWMEWARYLSMVFYAYSNMCIIEFKYGEPVQCSSNHSKYSSCPTPDNIIPVDEILAGTTQAGTVPPLWVNTLALLGFFFAARLATYLVLRFKYRPNY